MRAVDIPAETINITCGSIQKDFEYIQESHCLARF